jgi:cell division septation protein DedD
VATRASERETAVAAADRTCPRCGAAREHDQRYCLECGFALPETTGRLASLRRRWIRRFGWYPGDWVWLSLLTLLVAAGGAAAAIVIAERRTGARPAVIAAGPVVTVTEPTTAPTTETAAETPPRVRTTAPGASGTGWPTGENGWTIVLVSYPKTYGRPTARSTLTRARHAGLPQVGVLDSSLYASLQPGYYVVFTGVYGSKDDADAAVATARHAGFPGAYSREIAR